MATSIAKKTAPSNVRANVVINLIRTLTMTILSFITFPYVTRALGDQVFGLYTWANTFVYYFLILAKISIPNVAIRECSKVRDDPEKFSHLAQQFFLLQGITTLISFIFMTSLVFSVPSLSENSGLIFLLSLNFLTGVFSFEWIYIALEKHFYITVRSITLLALGALMTFVFIKAGASYPDSEGGQVNLAMNEVHIYALITVSTTIFTSLVNVLVLPRYVSFKKTAPYSFKGFVKPLLVLFAVSAALTLYNQTDEFILGFLDPSKASVGAYSVGVKGVDIVITLITSLYAVFMPRASYYYEKENKIFYQNLIVYSFNITFFIAIPAIATMTTLSGPITSLISGSSASGQYQDGAWVLVALSCMMLTYSIGDNIYTEIFIPAKQEGKYLYAMLIGVVLNIGLSFLFAYFVFPAHPAIGVAIATGGTDILLLAYLIRSSWKWSKKAIFNWNNLKICSLGVVIAVFTLLLKPVLAKALPFSSGTWQHELSLLLSLAGMDAVIYIGGLVLCKERLVCSVFRKKKEENHE